MTPVFNPPLLQDKDLQHLLSYLPEALFVGGIVRNWLLRQQINDIDITSALTPQEILKRFKKTDIKALPTGIDHGTITLIYKDLTIEHTTFRQDIETDGRHATVSFTTDIKQDAARRDFTINALYADQAGHIFDPTCSGLLDIKSKTVRFIGDAAQRIEEDALRILRFFRFSLYYGNGEFDPTGLDACHKFAKNITHLSKERITSEIFKILSHTHYIKAIRAMPIQDLFPKANIMHLESTALLEHSPLKHLIRLAALSEPYNGLEFTFPLFRFSKKEAKFLHFLISPPAIKSADHALYYHGHDKTLGLMLMGKLDCTPDKIQNWTPKTFPLTGTDLLNLGFSSSGILGKVLKETEEWWIEHHFTPTKADCETYIKSHFI